jgi:hypothetical protein
MIHQRLNAIGIREIRERLNGIGIRGDRLDIINLLQMFPCPWLPNDLFNAQRYNLLYIFGQNKYIPFVLLLNL